MSRLRTALQVGRTFGARDGMLRLSYELQRGTGLMARRMRSAEGWERWTMPRIAPDVSPETFLATRRNGKNPFFFRDGRTVSESLKKILGSEGEDRVLAQANDILEGKLPFFGQLSYSCGFPPNWFENPATGQRVAPQQSWTRMRFASADYGDLKFILEPSRFLFIYPLARAYAISGEERFADAFWIAVEDWARNNPPASGPLWICGQECALRILAWSFGLHSFLNSPATTPERCARLLGLIAAHCWRTSQSLAYARSQRSNHLISEAVGLWTAGTLYPELKNAKSWQRVGAQLLQEAALDQITPEGVSHQHSLNYQRMILQLLLWTLQLAKIHDISLDDAVHERAGKALDFIRSFVDPISGNAPNYGSNDGSLILPLAGEDCRDFRPLLQLGGAVLGRPPLAAGPWNEAALWLGLRPPEDHKKMQGWPEPAPGSGYFRLGDENSWALIRAGQYSRRPFQADQLHVDLWWRGHNLARDAGTYLYNGEPPWDNGLARSVVHNTVTVDGCDQMRRAGRFLWLDWAQASGHHCAILPNAPQDRFVGQHNGYRRLGVTHSRTVQWLADTGWVVIDDLQGSGQHEFQLHWLTPDLPFEASLSPFRVRFRMDNREYVAWNIFSSCQGQHAIVRAGQSCTPELEGPDLSLLGWESPTYGALQPAVSLVHRVRGALPVRFITVVLTDEDVGVQDDGDHITISQRHDVLFRVPLQPGIEPSVPTEIAPA